MSKKVIIFAYILYAFVSIYARDACFAFQSDVTKDNEGNYLKNNVNEKEKIEKNIQKIDVQKNKYSVNVFDYDEMSYKKNWISTLLENDFSNACYSLRQVPKNPLHLIAFPVNVIIGYLSSAFFDSNINNLFFQRLNLLVSFRNSDPQLYNYIERNINQDTKFYEENIYAYQDIINGIGVANLVNFRNEFQKQIANEINSKTSLTDRINNFITSYTLKNGFNLEQHYKTTVRYRILIKLGLKEKTFEEQRVREFLFTYLKTSIMFSLDAKYSYEYTVFRNNFFVGKDCDFLNEFSNFRGIFSTMGRYEDSDYYDMMDYFAWKIVDDEKMFGGLNITNINGFYENDHENKILEGASDEVNKIFSTSSEYQKLNFCFKCGALGQKLVSSGISAVSLCISYKVLIQSLVKSGLFWVGSSGLIAISVAPIISGVVLEYKKTKNFNEFMTQNFMNRDKYIRRNGTGLNANLFDRDLNSYELYEENNAKTEAKLLNIVKQQEKMIYDSSDKVVAVKVPVMEGIMNDYKKYISSNINSGKTIGELTDEFKQKLREDDFAIMREQSAKESKVSDKFTKIFSKIFYSVKSFFFGSDKKSSYIDYQKKYEYVSKIIDSVELYTMTASYHSALLNMYDDFVRYGNQKSFKDFFEVSWQNYLSKEIQTKQNSELYAIKKEFLNYSLEHIILDGLYEI